MCNYNDKLLSRGEEVISYKNEILAQLNLVDKKVLDLGCSVGIFNQDLIAGNEFWGLDQDEQALKKVRKKGYLSVTHDFNSGDPLPFDDASFDVVIAIDMLEHVVSPEFLGCEINRVLRKNGVFFVGVPNGYNIINRIMFLLGKPYDITDMQHFEGGIFSDHFHQFSLGKYERFLVDIGFTPIERFFYMPRGIRHAAFKIFSAALIFCNFIKINKWWPSLFSFSFLYFAQKTRQGDDVAF